MSGWKRDFRTLPMEVEICGHKFWVVAITKRGLALRHLTANAPSEPLKLKYYEHKAPRDPNK